MSERILYQFPISHYCEKSRWQLDHKGLEYRIRNLLPGPHRLRSQWLARINTLPILRDGKRVVGDSTKIAYYLEKYYPERSLTPADADQRAAMIELEQQMDRYGVHVRRWLYGQVIDRPEVMNAMLDPYRLPAPIQRWLTPITREGTRRLYRIEPKAVMRSEQRLEEGLAMLEAQLTRSGGEYLVGGRLSLADIAAASLLAPLVAPPGTPWDMFAEGSLPPALDKQLADLRERPVGRWVLERYRTDR
ncbi:glutathione S-transferase family protein [Alloalcanivorax mobilis]|uniref:glutathione S-transferase family protein n=1 Tax=Alloalcanivorax mobilis TaxID=2019569 RepID=UPI000C7592F7|nr:glutathione S-transferase family protein [Alloalcanivorax mobilis]|tara:strand:- start:7 stop:747 length:741 start_codon:yes stop_codon:yes gene_type:complete